MRERRPASEAMTFEARLARLEVIVGELESDRVDLARALALFEEGVECLRAASGELAEAEARIQLLVERADGSVRLSEFRDRGA
jgi:exodeoxyribonuclease VII small subunit